MGKTTKLLKLLINTFILLNTHFMFTNQNLVQKQGFFLSLITPIYKK